MIGIYRIKNKINNKCYYGSSKDIDKRWKRHIKDLKNKKHHSILLQRSWDKYGSDAFLFEIVEVCDIELLLKIEQKYLNLEPEYNIGKKASGGDNLTNNPNREEIIYKITRASIDRNNNLSDNEKIERYSKPMDKNPNWKGGITYNYCKCGKRITYKALTCKKCQDIIGVNNPFYGRETSKENKKYLSELFKGKQLHNNNIEIIIDGIEYISFTDAGKKLGILWATIRHRCLSKNPKYINYNIKGIEKVTYTDDEMKNNYSKSHIGKIVTSNNKPFYIDDIEYRTLLEASEKLNIHKMTIKGRLKSNKIDFSNYRYKLD